MRVREQAGREPGRGVRITAEHVGQGLAVGPRSRGGHQRQQQPGAERRGDVMLLAEGGVQAPGIPGQAAVQRLGIGRHDPTLP